MSARSTAIGFNKLLPQLPVCESTDQEMIAVTSEGFPVWPVSSPQQLKGLSQLAKVFDGIIHFPKTYSCGFAGGCERVLCLDPSLELEARLYAHLTGRSYVVIRCLGDLHNYADYSVLVTTFDHVNPTLLESIYRSSRVKNTPGIICAPSQAELRLQVLLRSAALFFCRNSKPANRGSLRWVDVMPHSSFQYKTKTRRVLGRTARRDSVRAALMSKADILRVVTTSDGIDVDIGKHSTICAIVRPEATADTTKSPRCVATGFCHRMHMPVEQALDSGVLLDPRFIRAKIMLWQTCLGVMVGSHVTDDRWGVGLQLLASETVGALISTCDYILTAAYCTETLAQEIGRGVPIGIALHNFHSARANETLAHRFFIFGDPDFTIHTYSSSDQRLVFKPERGRIKKRGKRPSPEPQESTEILAMLKAIRSRPKSERGYEGELALSLARNWRGNLERDTGVLADPEFGTLQFQMRDALIRYMISRRWARWMEDWLQHQVSTERLRAGKACPTCQTAPDTYCVSLDTAETVNRRLSICRRCGIIEDVPLNSSISFSVSSTGRCNLSGTLPSTDWLAYLIIFSDNQKETTLQRWPCTSAGIPREHFRPKGDWPIGPLRLGFFMISGSWYMLTQPFRWVPLAPQHAPNPE